jgi:hypothetical protein
VVRLSGNGRPKGRDSYIATYSNNTTIKYEGNLLAGNTVPAKCYAIATYFASANYKEPGATYASTTPYGIFQVYFGEGKTITSQYAIGVETGFGGSTTYASFVTCVFFKNSP